MKKTLIVVLLGLIGFNVNSQTQGKPTFIKPTNHQKRVTILVSGKTRYYYSLSDENPSVVTVNGPGKLKVITRGRFKPDQTNKLNYVISYSIDGGSIQTKKITSVERSLKATYEKGSLGMPSQAREFEITLGRGTHSIDFTLTDNTIQVEAQYIFYPTKGKKIDWIAYSPMQPSEPVELVTKETRVKYYRFSKEKPLKIEIIGPTELRVLSRFENHYNMKGRIHYRLQIRENGKVLNSYQLSNTLSDITVYQDNNSLIPGKACEFVIEVPSGIHVYEILPLDEDKRTILGRILIPKKDVKLKE